MFKPIQKDFLHIQFEQGAYPTKQQTLPADTNPPKKPSSSIRNYSDFTVWILEKLPIIGKWMGIPNIKQDVWRVSLPSADGLSQERKIYHLKASEAQHFQKEIYESVGIANSQLAIDEKAFSLWLETWGTTTEAPALELKQAAEAMKTVDKKGNTKEEGNIELAPLQILPEVNQTPMKLGAFVDVLNEQGYSINGKNITFPTASKPEKHSRSLLTTFAQQLHQIKKEIAFLEAPPYALLYKDRSTEQAISEGNTAKIALNFANEHHAGGGPGFHLDPQTQKFVYDTSSARAQEESMCQRSDLMASLVQLSHHIKPDTGSRMVRSYYDDRFDSKTMAYSSHNHLFAVQGEHGFYSSLLYLLLALPNAMHGIVESSLAPGALTPT